MSTELSKSEKAELAKHIKIIDDGMRTFYEVGLSLTAIRDGKLYRESHKTFEAFCKERWGLERRRAYQLIETATISSNLSKKCDKIPKEAHIKPLSKLPEEEQQDAWDEAVETAPDGKVTAGHVQEVVNRRLDKNPPEPVVICDELGDPITDVKIAEVFERAGELKAVMSDIQRIRKKVKDLAGQPVGAYLRKQQIDIDLKNAYQAVKFALPYAICPPGAMNNKDFKRNGWLTKDQYVLLPQELKD